MGDGSPGAETVYLAAAWFLPQPKGIEPGKEAFRSGFLLSAAENCFPPWSKAQPPWFAPL